MKTIDAEETKRERARQLRYKKPIIKNLNLESIEQELWDIQEACEEVQWYFNTNEATLINALDGDEEYEFKMMFADLCAECELMIQDINEEWVPDCFDRFFVAIGAGKDLGGLLGYDSYEQDYFGLSYAENDWAEDESRKALKRMKKDELIAAARQCFRVYQSFIALRHRYDCLQAAMDILRDQNTGYLQVVKQIEEAYEKADKETFGFKYSYGKSVNELDRILANMPQEACVQ